VLTYRDVKVCDTISSAAKMRKVSLEKKHKDLALSAETPRLNRFLQQTFLAATVGQSSGVDQNIRKCW